MSVFEEESYKLFEQVIENLFGDRMSYEKHLREDVKAAITDVFWYNPKKDRHVIYTYRSAGELIARITSKGDYLNSPSPDKDGVVTDEIAHLMKKEGWVVKDALVVE